MGDQGGLQVLEHLEVELLQVRVGLVSEWVMQLIGERAELTSDEEVLESGLLRLQDGQPVGVEEREFTLVVLGEGVAQLDLLGGAYPGVDLSGVFLEQGLNLGPLFILRTATVEQSLACQHPVGYVSIDVQ